LDSFGREAGPEAEDSTVMLLEGKIVLVTGGSRGIGRSIALRCAKEGASLALTYNVNRELAEEVVGAIRSEGGKAIGIQASIEERSSASRAIAETKRALGPVDILVNNAAIAQEKPFHTITDMDWNQMLAVNLGGPFICCQEVLPDMLKQNWGRIINISSIGGQWGGFNQVHYAASKAALISLTRSLARIYSGQGITTNAVAPGLVSTEMSAAEIDSAAGREKLRNIPIGRIATGEEVANVVAFLASEAASYITGQTMNVNGGMYFG
jgi:NAD(P)-dependent dehydrogenase (short-subunit alcohol dehydrogenase family)